MSYEYIKNLNLGWDNVYEDSLALSYKIKESNIQFDKIVAITKGGMFPTLIVASQLKIDYIDTFCIKSYQEKEQQKIQVIKRCCDYFYNEKVLFIDDLTDTGETIKYIKAFIPGSLFVKFGVLYTKPAGEHLVDFNVESCQQKTWIIFPWEY